MEGLDGVSGWNVRPGSSPPSRNMTTGRVRFRKHHRPCGQPAVEGGIASLRPLPEQAGHFTRIKAMPSDLPLMSTAWAMYPVPPQRGQFFGSTPPPQLLRVFHRIALAAAQTSFCYETRTSLNPRHGSKSGFPPRTVRRRETRGRFAGMVLLRQLSDKYSERLERNLASWSG
jgi:hypothetical protein